MHMTRRSREEIAAYDEVWSYGFRFAFVDLSETELDDGVIVARLLANSPSQIHHLQQQPTCTSCTDVNE